MKASAPKENHTGLETLELFAQAETFNTWLFENIAPYCSGTVLEIGSGIGNISKHLLARNKEVALSDLSDDYCAVLKEKYSSNPHLLGIYQIDLALPEFDSRYASLFKSFDTVVALNVVEHIRQDGLALENCKKLLKENGRLILLVPAYQFLFNHFDQELGHYRRYTKKTLAKLLAGQGLTLQKIKYFNMAGIPGWWFTGAVLKKRIIPSWQLSAFNKLVPLFKIIDKLFARKLGLSVIAIAKK
jgi:2-polyprenyl-3-methyl-5-hydroxy-6-metoxy-1,4-benzoquinol methylase